MADVSHLKYWCYKVLPLAYDDSLSYYEVLCKVTNKLNEVIDLYNDMQSTIEELQGYIDQLDTMSSSISTLTSGLAELKVVVASNKAEAEGNLKAVQTLLQGEIDDNVADLQKQISGNDYDIATLSARIDTNKSLVDSDVKVINETLDDLQTQIDALDTVNKTYIQEIQLWVQQELDSYRAGVNVDIVDLQYRVKDIEDRIKDLVVVDVWNYPLNSRVSLDVNNDQLYKDLGNALTEEQYDSLGLTAEEYASKGLNAMQYLRFSRDLLHYDWVYMPVSGVRQEVSNALTEIVNYMWNTVTAEEYAEVGLTAEEYAGLELDNNGYRNHRFGTSDSEGAGLTAEEYAGLELDDNGYRKYVVAT